jgi:hypothetical protein
VRNPEEGGLPFNSVEYEGSQTAVSYTFSYPVVLVQKTCNDVGPGESCIAHCPDVYDAEYEFYSNSYSISHLSGGACSTSDIVEADAFIGPRTYSCTVPTFSGEIVAQAVCVLNH